MKSNWPARVRRQRVIEAKATPPPADLSAQLRALGERRFILTAWNRTFIATVEATAPEVRLAAQRWMHRADVSEGGPLGPMRTLRAQEVRSILFVFLTPSL